MHVKTKIGKEVEMRRIATRLPLFCLGAATADRLLLMSCYHDSLVLPNRGNASVGQPLIGLLLMSCCHDSPVLPNRCLAACLSQSALNLLLVAQCRSTCSAWEAADLHRKKRMCEPFASTCIGRAMYGLGTKPGKRCIPICHPPHQAMTFLFQLS